MQPHDLDPYIAAALDDLVNEVQAQLDGAHEAKPIDQEEIAFWKRQRNAFVKAQTYFIEGTRLVETPSGYNVASASRPGALVHRIYKVGEIWTCSCEAGERGIFHWHTALVAAYERGAQDAAVLEPTLPDAPPMPAWAIEAAMEPSRAAVPALPAWAVEEDAALAALAIAA